MALRVLTALVVDEAPHAFDLGRPASVVAHWLGSMPLSLLCTFHGQLRFKTSLDQFLDACTYVFEESLSAFRAAGQLGSSERVVTLWWDLSGWLVE